MTWPPAARIGYLIFENAAFEIDLKCINETHRAYLREFFEAIIRLRSRDMRISRIKGLPEIVAQYDDIATPRVLDYLTMLNGSLRDYDSVRQQMPRSNDSRWEPLALTRVMSDMAADAVTYVTLISETATSHRTIRASREVIEAILAISCGDERRSYLTPCERDILGRLAAPGTPHVIAAYTFVNVLIGRLNLDSNIDITELFDEDDEA